MAGLSTHAGQDHALSCKATVQNRDRHTDEWKSEVCGRQEGLLAEPAVCHASYHPNYLIVLFWSELTPAFFYFRQLLLHH